MNVYSGTTRELFAIETDHLNAPRRVSDTQNRTRWTWGYGPFGDTPPNTSPENLGAFEFNLRFPGQYHDEEIGLFYNYFRSYHPALGRYTQSDRIGLNRGMNSYAYVEGNPLSNIDPMGLRVRPPPPIPGNFGRYPYIPDAWRKDYYRDYRAGHYRSVCVAIACPLKNFKECTSDNPLGSPITWRGGSFVSAPGDNSLSDCVCTRSVLEWFPGWDTPNFIRNLIDG